MGAALAAGAPAFAAGQAAGDPAGPVTPAMRPAGLILAATSVEAMTPEMRRAYVRGIQEELAEHGYDPGPADGVLGPRTRAAIRRYQRDAGLPVDGVASKELLDHIKFAQPRVDAKPPPAPDPLVLEVQTRLQELGYHRGALDGVMGATTRESIRAYRYDAGLPVTGAIDRALLERLRPAQAEETGPGATTGGVEAPEETWPEPEPAE